MATVKINGKKYAVPSGWKDITVSQFIDLVVFQPQDDIADLFRRMEIITGIPYAVLENLDMAGIETLRTMTDFINDQSGLEAVNVFPKELEGFKVGEQPAKTILQVQGCLQRARQKLPNEPEGSALLWLAMGREITEIYLESAGIKQDIGQEPITKWYGLMCFFLNRSVHFSVATLTSMVVSRLRTRSMQASKRYQPFRRISAWLKQSLRRLTKRATPS